MTAGRRPLQQSSMLETGHVGKTARVRRSTVSDALLERLRELADLRRQGLLSDDEFAVQKRKLLPH